MIKLGKYFIGVVLVFVFVSMGFADSARVRGEISEVTVYHGQALVSREVEVDIDSGTSEVIVSGLPNRIVSESLYAQSGDGVKVLSVRYRERAVRVDTREEVKQLDEQIKEVRNELRYAERNREHMSNIWSRYDNIWKLTADATNEDYNKGVLQSKEVEGLSQFLEEKYTSLHENSLKLEDEIAALKEELELLNRRRKELDAGRSRTEREAVLYISDEGRGKSRIELNYLVNEANWLPQYNLRAEPEESSVVIEYNAVVNQRSGEDWNNVKLNLSTAEPSMAAQAALLEPVSVGLFSKSDQKQAELPGMGGMIGFDKRSDRFSKLLRSRREQSKRGAGAQKELEQLAVSNQMIELSIDERELKSMKQQIQEISRVEGVSVSYELDGRLSLPSRSDQQLVTIASEKMAGDFTLVSTPLLTDYVYLQAEVINDSDTVFLAGPARMFRNGDFVGKSEQPLVTIGEKFTAGFGIDSQIQVVREFEDKKTRIQGGNRIDTYNYLITLSNYKNTPAEIRLLDRLPFTENKSIKIELIETSPKLSDEREYVRTRKKKGILRWDLNLGAKTVDEQAKAVKYSFTIEYDKNMQILPEGARK